MKMFKDIRQLWIITIINMILAHTFNIILTLLYKTYTNLDINRLKELIVRNIKLNQTVYKLSNGFL